MIESVPQHYFG